MTDHKQLKRRIRDRARRTGESYTTARRHVLAAAADDAGGSAAVAGYPEFGGGQHRPSTLLRHLLRRDGIELSEAMLCGLGGGIGFMVAVFDYRGLPPILTIVAQHHPEPWLPAALTRLGVGFDEAHSGSAGPALVALRSALAQGRAVYCTVAATALPWREREPYLDTDPHGIVVAGERDGVFLVDDEAVAPHELPAEALAAAWSAHRKGRHHRLILHGTPPVADLGDAVRAAVATTVAHLTGPVLGNAFDVNFGLSGMARLAAQLRDARTKAGFVRRFAEPAALAFALRRLYECLELRDTAPGATRPLFADFLDEAAALTGNAAWRDAAGHFRRSAAHWSALAERAADTLDSSGGFARRVEERLLATLRGTGSTPAEESSTELVLSDGDRLGLFESLADLVDAARREEEAAVVALREP
jgi:hypothetical protein